MLPLSARTPAALVEIAEHYRNWLSEHPEAALSDVCFTAGVGRSHFEHRAALVVNSTESARELLGALADDRPAPGLVRGECGDPPKTAWLFPGQGSQYAGMARELFDTEPVFAETMTRCAAAVDDVLERPLLDVIFDADAPTAKTSCGTPRTPSPRCSRWRWAWRGSGSRGASNRTWCWDTASANIRRPVSRVCSASRTARC